MILWQQPTKDVSSSVTGSSVFDFQGDGAAEVVYNDECFLHIYDGRTAAELLTGGARPNSSRTRHEYPLVVDADLDGNSEIVVPANNDQLARDGCLAEWRAFYGVGTNDELPASIRNGTQGIFVFGDPGDRWVRTRPIWNQYTYHVTNIEDDGSVPVNEVNSWADGASNTYRTNTQGERLGNAPNLQVTLDVVPLCGRRTTQLVATVRNVGSRGVAAGVGVAFFDASTDTPTSIGTAMTSRDLLPGGVERVVLSVSLPDLLDVRVDYRVEVDGESASASIRECVEDDNDATGTVVCSFETPF